MRQVLLYNNYIIIIIIIIILFIFFYFYYYYYYYCCIFSGFHLAGLEPVTFISWRLPSDYNVAIVSLVWRRRRCREDITPEDDLEVHIL